MYERIRFRNFRVLSEADLSLSPFTLIGGPLPPGWTDGWKRPSPEGWDRDTRKQQEELMARTAKERARVREMFLNR